MVPQHGPSGMVHPTGLLAMGPPGLAMGPPGPTMEYPRGPAAMEPSRRGQMPQQPGFPQRPNGVPGPQGLPAGPPAIGLRGPDMGPPRPGQMPQQPAFPLRPNGAPGLLGPQVPAQMMNQGVMPGLPMDKNLRCPASTCIYEAKSVKSYLDHVKIHDGGGLQIPCPFTDCPFSFKKAVTLYRHMEHVHKRREDRNIVMTQDEESKFTCMQGSCLNKTVTNIREFRSHLFEHAEAHEYVQCPFKNCNKRYNQKTSLKCHFTRTHKNHTVFDVRDQYVINVAPIDSLDIPELNDSSEDCGIAAEWDDDQDSDSETDLTELSNGLVGGVADFYNALMNKKRVPYKTTDFIAEKVSALHFQNMKLVENAVRKVLLVNEASDITNEVISEIRKSDIMGIVHSKSSNVNMYSQHGRLKFIDNNMPFVPPIKVVINPSEPVQKQRELYYVPIADTLKMILKDSSYQSCASFAGEQGDQFGNILDSEVYKENKFFQSNPSAIPLILYSDEVTITNPLSQGTAKKHKILVMYYTLGTIPAWNRTKVDTLQLIMAIRSEDYKQFPQSQCYKKVLYELKLLETTGFDLDGETVRAGVLFYSSDNLEAHSIGGFSTNFNHDFICRVCDIKHEDLGKGRIHDFSDPGGYPPFSKLTEFEYDQLAEQENGTRVKHHCIFNELESFHASRQFAPCLGHDLLEGVVSYDVYCFLKIMVQKRGWFSLDRLNHNLSEFKFPSKDRPNTIVLANRHKLSGSAAQMWNLVRYLPYILYDMVPNLDDPVYDLLVKLHNIVDFCTSPILTSSEIELMDVMIQEYLNLRQDLVTDETMCSAKPKHHFISHYPFLYKRYGPLILCWTLRFESKHRFFKDLANKAKNFINFLKMSCTRHQRFQAHLLYSGLFSSDFMMPEKAIDINQAMAANKVQTSLTQRMFVLAQSIPGKVYISSSVSYRGTRYTVDQFVILSSDAGSLQIHLGKVLKCVISNTHKSIHFVIRPYLANNSGKGFFNIAKQGDLEIVSLSKLTYYVPLNVVPDTDVLILHHYPSTAELSEYI
jgi:hypothetical protein